ncbi:FliH/SctL family protein [Roseospira navarrensis]|uniref:Flagellar assembly protein FliH n=1 Tax=Roseospira navarrensis TaxID=140058 RepID=A0A7X1ZH28_9PROT|nr:FliH/SctL family protein [Roseospira navarrensis]MQX37894.1 hypothetical protein [Roseospira navarrensis]
MATVHKFLFDRSFDDPRPGHATRRKANRAADATKPADAGGPIDPNGAAEAAEAESYAGLDRRRHPREDPAPPPPEMFTREQLDAAREEGYIKGHTQALEEAATADSHVTATALKTIVAAIDRMDAEEQARVTALQKTATRLALAVTRRVLPATGEAQAGDEIEHLIARILPDMLDQPRLVVRVNGALAEVVRSAVRGLQTTSGYEGRVVVRPDNALAREDCRLEWGEGGIERDTARLWEDIEAAVSRHLNEAVPPAPAPDTRAPAPPDGGHDAAPEASAEGSFDIATEAEPVMPAAAGPAHDSARAEQD